MEEIQDTKKSLGHRLHESLQGLIGLHRQLYETVKAENEAITNADVTATYETTANKETLVHTIRQAEMSRQAIASAIHLEAGLSTGSPSLKEIILHYQGSDLLLSERLQSDLSALLILVERIKSQNSMNGKLVESSLRHINNMKSNIFGETTHQAKTYNQMGQKNQAAPNSHGPRLISKEV